MSDSASSSESSRTLSGSPTPQQVTSVRHDHASAIDDHAAAASGNTSILSTNDSSNTDSVIPAAYNHRPSIGDLIPSPSTTSSMTLYSISQQPAATNNLSLLQLQALQTVLNDAIAQRQRGLGNDAARTIPVTPADSHSKISTPKAPARLVRPPGGQLHDPRTEVDDSDIENSPSFRRQRASIQRKSWKRKRDGGDMSDDGRGMDKYARKKYDRDDGDGGQDETGTGGSSGRASSGVVAG